MEYDLLIKNGSVIDGTAAPRAVADVAVRDGRIVATGRVAGSARRVINADGLIVAPGFIDLHTHYDPHLEWDPLVTSSSWHGVTTVVTGNCGLTLAPCKPEDQEQVIAIFSRVEELPPATLKRVVSMSWTSFGDYLNTVDKGLGSNVAPLVGHNALRLFVMGKAAGQRPANEEEVRAMQRLLRQAMREGAHGWSTTLAPSHVGPHGEPVPSRLASHEELLALARAAAEAGSSYIELATRTAIVGLAEEDRRLVAGLARESQRPVAWIFHDYKWWKPDGWREEQQWMMREARNGNRILGAVRLQPVDRRVNLRRTTLFNRLAVWRDLMQLPLAERSNAFGDAGLRPRLREAIDKQDQSGKDGAIGSLIRWEALCIQRAKLEKNKPLEGKKVTELAEERGVHVADAILDLAVEEGLDTDFRLSMFLESEDPVRGEQMKSEHVLLGQSDAGAHINSDCIAGEPTYFLRHWCLDKGLLPLEEGVRRFTSVPAEVLGISDRGYIRPGYAADMVIFDPGRLRALPGELLQDVPGQETRYVQQAEGVCFALVNGQVTVEDGVATGARPGLVLRGRGYSQASV